MVAKFVLVVLFALCADALVLVNNPLYCYSLDRTRPQLNMFGTTTEYDVVRGRDDIDSRVSKCTPSRFWFQGRHGSRFPSVADGDNLFSATDTINVDIINKYNAFKTTLCPSDAQLIKNWQINPNFTLTTPGALTQSGWTELKNLAGRLQKAFPTLLPNRYTAQHYFFRHSPIPRTLTSAQAFADGLFAPNVFNSVDYIGQNPDYYLTPFNNCPTWFQFYSSVPEATVFAQGQYYQQMVKQVSEKLGFKNSEQLPANTVDKMITHCKYEQIYNHIAPSPFCSAFSVANHQVNEYYRDLQFSYLSAYGNPAYRKLYENMSCYLLQAMLQFLQSNDPSDQKAKLWFGHDVTLQFMFTALGLFEDATPLTGSNFPQQTNRQWKSSYLTPMGGNMAVIRFE